MSTKQQILQPTKGWQVINFREIVAYRDLLYFLTIRGIKSKYAQSILGIGWAVIQPVVSTLVFTIIFGNLAQVDSHGIPYLLFSYLGMLPWLYFSNTLNESANSLISNAGMINKVYFPRLVLPLAAGLSKFLDFLIGFVILLFIQWYYGYSIHSSILLVPFLVMLLLFSSLGSGMILAALSVQYRDVKHALSFMIQLLMYATPVVYSSYAVPQKYQFWFALNPMTGVIEGFRSVFTGSDIPWNFLLQSLIISVLLMLIGMKVFRRMERTFADLN